MNTIQKQRGYTLIETLVASAVIMISIAAASSLSLAMVTQEEMSERTVRASNHLENAATLYQIGVDTSQIPGLLPVEPVVNSLTFSLQSIAVTDLGNVDVVDIVMTYTPSNASATNDPAKKSWTGGNTNVTPRTHSVRAMRSSH